MRSLVLGVSRRTMRSLKAMLIPGLALLLALLPAAVVNMAMPMPVSAAVAPRGSATTGTTVNTNLTIDKPTGVVAGDVMIVNIAQVGNKTTAPLLLGWKLIAGADLGGAPPRYGAVLYRVADGTEGLSFTFALGAGTDGAVGSIVAFSGVDTSGADPFDVAPGAISVAVTDQTAVSATSISTVSANAAVVMFGMAAHSAPTWSDWTANSSVVLNELYDSQVSGTYEASVGAAWVVKAAAGATGAGTATLSSAERNGGILIALKPLKPTALTVATATGTYGDTANLAATLSPAVPGETISFTLNGAAAGTAVTDDSGMATVSAASLSGIDAGSYPAGVRATFAGDADVSSLSGTASLTVKPRDVTVTADDKGKVYGDADPELTYHISSGSLVTGDTFSGSVARAAGEDAGTYAVQQGTLELGSNYKLTFVEGTFTIYPRDIVVTADNCGKAFGDADPALTYTITSGSLAASDAFSGKLSRIAGEDIGTYAIQRGTLALKANYNFTFIDGTFTISAESISAPTVDSISPQSGQPGDTLDVVIRGGNLSGATAVNFGPGVTVNNFAVERPTRIVANITIDPAAELGDNNLVITTPSGDVTAPFSIGVSAGRTGASGLWLILILVLLAIALGFLLFAWFKRRKKRVEPELAPILAPVRPLGGTREAAKPAEVPADMDQPLGEATKAVDLEQAPVAAASVPLQEAEKPAELDQTPAAASQPPEATPEAVEPEQAPIAAVAADQLPEVAEKTADLEQAPEAAAAATQPLEETDKTAVLSPAPAVAVASKPRRRTTKRKPAGVEQAPAAAEQPPRRTQGKAPASTQNRSRTPAKRRKKASG